MKTTFRGPSPHEASVYTGDKAFPEKLVSTAQGSPVPEPRREEGVGRSDRAHLHTGINNWPTACFMLISCLACSSALKVKICNWFANWRRKLKNAGSEAPHHTWGNLIKSYNTKAQGNVEQFSLCSDDSIWEENDISDTDQEVCHEPSSKLTIMQRDTMSSWQAKKFHKDVEGDSVDFGKHRTDVNARYNSVIESDVKNGCENLARKSKRQKKGENRPLELSKWLESAAKFKPGQNYVAWSTKNATWQSSTCEMKKAHQWNVTANDAGNYWAGGQHHREELDAAEALTRLSALHQ
ncbi:hypothetical protein B7P43_G11199 [Cryptotermes secundus]|uniref:Uncharacterized protein n=1 Tax=Cryptotermes secundus TaxID=105785 RepID=A0A2J7QMB2_9NEOP|nr:hypothetical protein B7P43_G11199 [Cryptotermes secundus]